MQKPLAYKYTFLLLLGVVLIAVLLIWTAPEPPDELTPPIVMQVDTSLVEQRDVQPRVRLSGVLQPARRAELRFEVEGVVKSRHVEPGQAVAEGAPLLGLDLSDYQDAVIEARARLAQEEAAVERDRAVAKLAARNSRLQADEVSRNERLGTQSLASQAALDAARQKLITLQMEEERLRYAVVTADERVNMLKAALRRAERNLSRAELVAPFAGRVNSVLVEPGDFVVRNQPVLELVGMAMMEVYVEVPGEVAAHLQSGDAVDVHVGGDVHQGEIIAVQPVARADTSTHGISIQMADPGVLPGALAEVVLPLAHLPQATVIPVTALAREDGIVFVFVVKDQVLARREVKVGYREGEVQVITAGLEIGELIVSRGAAALTDGQTVKH